MLITAYPPSLRKRLRKIVLSILTLAFLLAMASAAEATVKTRIWGYVEKGAQVVTTSGVSSSTKHQRTYPSATVTVYLTGTTTLASLYTASDGATLASNPFTSDSTGYYYAYVEPGLRVDVRFSGTGILTPWTIGDVVAPVIGSSIATTSSLGSVRLSTAPLDSANPIVISATDPLVDPNKNYVLTFTGTTQMIDAGLFFTGTLDHDFLWEAWVKPGAGASSRYFISDGSGGGHALLLGTVSDGAGAYQISGNIWSTTSSVARTFGSDEGPLPQEWCLLAVGMDRSTNRVVTYYDGVPVGVLAFTDARGPATAAGQMYIGGSDHQNWIGSISQIRGYEGSNPRAEILGNNADTATYIPSTIFLERENGFDANFFVDFLRPSSIIRDEGIGFPAGTKHTARLRGSGQFFSDASSTMLGAGNNTGTTSSYPLPQYEQDAAAPSYRTDTPPTLPTTTYTPASVPGTAYVFDSFNRRNITYAFDENGGLGSTEGGSAGALAWTVKAVDPGEYYPFGILNGKAVVLANKVTWAYVNAGVANQDIRVDRRATSTWGNGVSTGVIFRYTDALNYWWAYTLGTTTASQSLYVVKVVAGTPTTLINGTAMPASWTTLKVVTLSSGTVKVYGDSTQVDSTITDAAGQSATRAGIFCPTTGRGLYYRYDNFTILPGS